MKNKGAQNKSELKKQLENLQKEISQSGEVKTKLGLEVQELSESLQSTNVSVLLNRKKKLQGEYEELKQVREMSY